MEEVLKVNNLCKAYKQVDDKIIILDNLSFTLEKKQIVALVGPSGSGKSTLLNILGLLDKKDSGEIKLNNVSYDDINNHDNIRGKKIGFIFQAHNLLAEFTAIENVKLAGLINNYDKNKLHFDAENLLVQLKLQDRLHHFPGELSGGEKQRVAIARALINKPDLLLADEPTGNLDLANREIVFDMLINLIETGLTSAIIATHDLNLANRLDKILYLENGKIKL